MTSLSPPPGDGESTVAHPTSVDGQSRRLTDLREWTRARFSSFVVRPSSLDANPGSGRLRRRPRPTASSVAGAAPNREAALMTGTQVDLGGSARIDETSRVPGSTTLTGRSACEPRPSYLGQTSGPIQAGSFPCRSRSQQRELVVSNAHPAPAKVRRREGGPVATPGTAAATRSLDRRPGSTGQSRAAWADAERSRSAGAHDTEVPSLPG